MASDRDEAPMTQYCKARQYVEEGYRCVVDIDLEKFFDHREPRHAHGTSGQTGQGQTTPEADPGYLTSGIMYEGVVQAHSKGTPQGSPLSPLLSNILLDELDKELERRGHRFCRYADDCNIYVKSAKGREAGNGINYPLS